MAPPPHQVHPSLRGGAVEYRRWPGGGDGPMTLILLHEGLGSVAQWKDFPQRLAAATGCPVLAYSRHGYGGSAPAALPRPLDYLRREAVGPLPELLSALNIGRHVLIGHSDGGSIALLNAALAPSPHLTGLVALAPHVFVEDVTIAGIAQALNRYRNETDSRLRQGLARYHGANVDIAFHGWADTWLHPNFRSWNVEAEMAGIGVPTLLIQGRGDEYASLAQIERIAARIPALAECLVIEKCGHNPHLEQPDAVTAAVAAFIGGLARKSGIRPSPA